MSKSRINRICGARILGGMDASVRYRGKYSNETDLNSDKIYLSTRDFKVEKTGKAPSKIAEIQRELSMEYVDKGILEDEEIESVGDFYANLKEMTLSAEWHRRHGAFIGLGNLKIEKEIGSGSGIVVEMDAGEMIGRCFVILKNDKFNDYVDNKAVAPVREAVGEYLCKLAEHKISAENLVEQLFKLLGDACWHVQYGALHAIHLCIKNQIKHIVHKTETNKELFIALIRSKDEDIKCVAADILSQIVEQLSVDEIARIGRSAIDQFKVEDAL
ncbi:BTAF1, partial [Enterospora canceri]